YSGLFLLSAILLLGITNGVGSTSSATSTVGNGLGGAPEAPAPPPAPGPHDSSASHRYLIASLLALGVMVVVSLVVGWMISGRILRPLRVITRATQRISADRLHERLAMRGPADELKNLSDTIDGLLERLEGAFTAQRRFVANASHELRTPLAT